MMGNRVSFWMRKTTHIAFLSLFLVATATVAIAQQTSDGPFVLHEYFEGDVEDKTSDGAATRDPHVPGAPPSLSMETNRDELVFGADGPLNDARLERPYGDLSPFGTPNQLDSNTDRVNNLNYFANFEPSVIPYKRVVSQNRVRRTAEGRYEVYLEPGRRRAVRVGGLADGRHATFWGTFMFRAEANRFMPIASVGPNQTVLEVRTEPPVPIEVLVDDAGNFMIRTSHQGLLRVNMQVAVPDFYFTGEMKGASWDDLAGAQPLSPVAHKAAKQVLEQVGIDTQLQSPGEAMNQMVSYFRDFEGKPFPKELDTGDLYTSIALNQIGVCRHRSLAFLVTASALGFRTRYVYNEAHAFVEVFWPGGGWRRIDLGGAADQMNATTNGQQGVHSAPDSLPQPKRFLEEQERMVQSGWDPATQSGSGGGTGGDGPPEGQNGAIDASDPLATGDPSETSDPTSSSEPKRETRPIPRLRFLRVTKLVKRGGAVSVLARLTRSDGRPLAGREVQIHLGAVGSRQPSSSTLIATVTSSEQGWVIEDVVIPPAQSIGRWSMFIFFPGDEEFRPIAAE